MRTSIFPFLLHDGERNALCYAQEEADRTRLIIFSEETL